MKRSATFATVTAFMLYVAIAPVSAQSKRTDQLMWDCEGKGEIGELGILHCVSYLSGMADLSAALNIVYGTTIFCVPKAGVSADQLRLIFIKWAHEHPEDLHTAARVSAIIALSEAFPCAD